MKTIKTIALTTVLALFSVSSNAQMKLNNPEEKSEHALGVALGMTTGYGISYRYSPSKFSFQLAFSPYKTEREYKFVTGLSFYYKVVDNKKVDFFVYQANELILEERYVGFYDPYFGPISQGKIENHDHMNHGIGFGFEFLIKNRVTFNLMGGYGAFENFNTITPTIETSLFYNF